MKRTFMVSLLPLLLVAFLIAAPATAQDKMTFEEYQAEVDSWMQREQAAQSQVTALQGEIDALKQKIRDLENQISTEWQNTYDALGVSEDELADYARRLDMLAGDIANFSRLTPEEIYQQSAQLDELYAAWNALKAHPAANLTQYRDNLDRLGAQLDSIKARMAKPRVISYTVVRGDYLWKIAKNRDHYGDGMKWMRIYSVNRDQIEDPDLIFPDQSFIVPLDVDMNQQYLVQRGDHLYGIAESLYNDPFQWRKLYEANKEMIEDPNYIVPEMILTTPGR